MTRRNDLEEHFPRTAEVARANLDEWLSGDLPLVPAEALSTFVDEAPVALLHDSFWRRVPFGTGGVRGTIGFGPNRINKTVIALAVQGHCDFLHRQPQDTDQPTVVIANDVREFHDVASAYGFLSDNPLLELTSRSLARLAAEVYVANSFTVAMCDPDDDLGLLSTPELSFLIRRLGAVGGVNLSASHNPPDDNGIKIYDDLGGQFTPPLDQDLVDAAGAVTEVRQGSFAEARAQGTVYAIDQSDLDAYRDEYVVRLEGQHLTPPKGTRVGFTPLGGCGERSVVPVLEGLGYEVFVAEGQGRDGTFSQIPLLAPNPEVAESTGPARAAAEHSGIGIVLAADPDADRLGVDVMTDDGWVHLTGNQISSVLAYFLMADPAGPQLRGAVYQTLVTTMCVPRIAERVGAGPIVEDLLVGFKYIARAVHDLEQSGTPADALMAFASEESHGYLVTAELRDKDATSAAVYLAALHGQLSADGYTLADYLARIYDDVGEFGDCGRSLVLKGSDGIEAIAGAMVSLREDPPAVLGGMTVTGRRDHWDLTTFPDFTSATDREARNIVVYSFDGGRVTFRPSGTEPKLKFYVQTTPEVQHPEAPQRAAEAIAAKVYGETAERMGLPLSDAAVLLPDVLAVPAKVRFDEAVTTMLSSLDEVGPEEAWAGLRRELVELVPGRDPVGPVQRALVAALEPVAATASGSAVRALVDAAVGR
jgi:phosphoglucomutase/phosphomannomutase